MDRRLRLRRETLAELPPAALGGLGGGSHLCGVTDACTHGASLDADCPTEPVLVCASLNPTCRITTDCATVTCPSWAC